MYDKKEKKDWATAVVTAAVGAGIAATFSVSQGQSPVVALIITAFATVTALVIDMLI